MNNMEIRTKLIEYGIRNYQLADALGVSENTLSRWLRNELPEDKKRLVWGAISEMTGEPNPYMTEDGEEIVWIRTLEKVNGETVAYDKPYPVSKLRAI